MYKLFTDKSELFECNIKLEGASLSKSKARLVVETSDYSLLFNGSIDSKGKCEIPIRKLKGLVDENTTGNISSSAGTGSFGSLVVDGSSVDFSGLPTSDPGVAGRLYNDSGTVKISL